MHFRLDRKAGVTGGTGNGDDHAGPGRGHRGGRHQRGSHGLGRSRIHRLWFGRERSGHSLTLTTHHTLTGQRPRLPPRGLRASLPHSSARYSDWDRGYGNSCNRGNMRGRRGHRAHGRQRGPRVVIFSHGFIDKVQERGGSRSGGNPDWEGRRRNLDDIPGVVVAAGGRESDIIAEFGERVVHVSPPIEAHAVGGDPGAVSDPGVCDGGSNKQHVEAINGRKGVHVDEEVVDDPFVVVREVGAEFTDEGSNVKVTMRVHQGIRLIAEIPHNGGGVKANTRHDGGLRKREMTQEVHWPCRGER